MIACEDCKYFEKEANYCTWIACDGLDCDEPLPCETDEDIRRGNNND